MPRPAFTRLLLAVLAAGALTVALGQLVAGAVPAGIGLLGMLALALAVRHLPGRP